MVNPDKRRRIVRSALEVISEKGFHAAPMAMIADHAGVASGTIYDFFKSKDVLIAEVYQDIVERIYPVLLKEYQTGKTIRDCYLLVCTALLKHFMRNRYDLGYLEQYHESVLASEPFIRREVEYRRKDGTPFLGNIYMRAARDQNGRLQFFEGL